MTFQVIDVIRDVRYELTTSTIFAIGTEERISSVSYSLLALVTLVADVGVLPY